MLPVSDFRVKKREQNPNLIGRVKVQLLVGSAVLVVGLFFAQLVFANSLATDGQKLSKIQGEIAIVEAQNTTMKVQIAHESSLKTLSEKAQKLGFDKPGKILGLR